MKYSTEMMKKIAQQLGEMIKTDGYASVFLFTMWLGGLAVVACIIEWVRQARADKETKPRHAD